jgi:hypothetical protein
LTEHSTFYLLVDATAILATAIMLYWTEKQMPNEDPKPNEQEQRIHAMLDSANNDGYVIEDWSVDDIVADLLAYAELSEEETEDAIRPHVITWKANRSTPT